ncbi:GATA zinc finger domain-containing protein [Favolaschia claudopus]|uniref:GATA zinc finger domain-containing protein n=1 Tax=Favolaschia claudopus TaxID=2862362 RepID=A0AAV9Z5H8_9AGAR
MGSNPKRPHYTSRSSSDYVPHAPYNAPNQAGNSYPNSVQQQFPSGYGTYNPSSQQSQLDFAHGMLSSADSIQYHQSSALNPYSEYPGTPGAYIHGSVLGTHPTSHQPYTPNSLDEYIMTVGGPPPPSSPIIPYNYAPPPLPSAEAFSAASSNVLTAARNLPPSGEPRDPQTHEPLCNACGVYVQQRRLQRPQQLIDADLPNAAEDEGSEVAPQGPECSHCHARETSVWRRDPEGNLVCNACGVYDRSKGVKRPLDKVKSGKIRPRTRT